MLDFLKGKKKDSERELREFSMPKEPTVQTHSPSERLTEYQEQDYDSENQSASPERSSKEPEFDVPDFTDADLDINVDIDKFAPEENDLEINSDQVPDPDMSSQDQMPHPKQDSESENWTEEQLEPERVLDLQGNKIIGPEKMSNVEMADVKMSGVVMSNNESSDENNYENEWSEDSLQDEEIPKFDIDKEIPQPEPESEEETKEILDNFNDQIDEDIPDFGNVEEISFSETMSPKPVKSVLVTEKFIEKNNYFEVLSREEEVSVEIKLIVEDLEKVLGFSSEEKKLYTQLASTMKEVKDSLLRIDTKIFE